MTTEHSTMQHTGQDERLLSKPNALETRLVHCPVLFDLPGFMSVHALVALAAIYDDPGVGNGCFTKFSLPAFECHNCM